MNRFPYKSIIWPRLFLRFSLLLPILFVNLCCCLPTLAEGADFKAGLQCLRYQQYDRALRYFDSSVDAEPTNSDFHFWRGRCLACLSRTKDAIAEYRVAYLLTSDLKLKEYCRQELTRYKQPIPKASVADSIAVAPDGLFPAGASGSPSASVPSVPGSAKASGSRSGQIQSSAVHREGFASDTAPVKSGNTFKLSSKKLEWDLQMNSTFLKSLQTKNADLDKLAAGPNWRLPANVAMTRAPMGRRGMALADLPRGPAHATSGLSQSEITDLLHSDIVIIIDHSGSMSAPDCPSGANGTAVQSRLNWVVEELDGFARNIVTALPHGFTLITFESRPEVFPIRNLTQFRNALHGMQGDGGTDLAAALKEAFRVHTAHIDQPLLIAVITDAEIDVQSSEQAIISATQRFPMPNGVFINLMQIGYIAEAGTADTLALLGHLQTRAGTAYDPFVGIPFSKLRQDGIGRDILSAFRTAVSASTSASATVVPPKNNVKK